MSHEQVARRLRDGLDNPKPKIDVDLGVVVRRARRRRTAGVTAVTATAMAVVGGMTVAAVALGPSSVSDTSGPPTSSAEPVCPESGVLATGPATVTGTVTLYGEAASGGELTFIGDEGLLPVVPVSDAGQYEVELPSGEYSIEYYPLGKEAFFDSTEDSGGPDTFSFEADIVMVVKGQNSIDFEVDEDHLMKGYAGARTGTLCGTVTNPVGEIVSGGELSFQMWKTHIPVLYGPVTTVPLSDTGQYAVELPAGHYLVEFHPAGQGEPESILSGPAGFVVTSVGGQDKLVNLYRPRKAPPEPEPGSASTVSGTVADPGAVSTGNERLMLSYLDPGGWGSGDLEVPVSSDGTFTVDLAPGNYHVWLAVEHEEFPELELKATCDRPLTVVNQPMVLAIEVVPPTTNSARLLTITVLPG
ncbi:MAG: hypothetical protein FWF02_05000 [Micrococcales bacterium]|nr:hypothetical protein [Micrococcales bacterium]MCL2667051.1 hypothetical protein [Micrococcales bacterium]